MVGVIGWCGCVYACMLYLYGVCVECAYGRVCVWCMFTCVWCARWVGCVCLPQGARRRLAVFLRTREVFPPVQPPPCVTSTVETPIALGLEPLACALGGFKVAGGGRGARGVAVVGYLTASTVQTAKMNRFGSLASTIAGIKMVGTLGDVATHSGNKLLRVMVDGLSVSVISGTTLQG